VVFHGELWDARAEQPVAAGDQVEVLHVTGRIAQVKPIDQTRPVGQES